MGPLIPRYWTSVVTITTQGDKTKWLGTILVWTVKTMSNSQLVREWVCLQQQELPIGLQVATDWQQMCLTRSGPFRDLEMRQGLVQKKDDPGSTHVYTHTVIQQLTSLWGGFLKEFRHANPFFFLWTVSSLFRLSSCSCVELQCDLNKKNPPLPSSLIKGVNNYPSLTVYYPPWQ